MMKDEEVEKLLRAMPLKKPVRMPETLSARPGTGRRGWAALGRVVRCQVPAWQAAAAALLAVTLYASASSLLAHASKEFPQTHETEFGLPTKITPSDADATVATASQSGFWRLPPSYVQMAAAAWKKDAPGTHPPQ